MKLDRRTVLVALLVLTAVVVALVVAFVMGRHQRPTAPLLANGNIVPASAVQPTTRTTDLQRARDDVGQVQKVLLRYRMQHGGSFKGLNARTIAKAAPKASFQLVYVTGGRVCAEIDRGDHILHVTQTGTGPGACPRAR